MPLPPCTLLVHALTKRYGDLVAVDGLELAVRPGEILGFLGPNGAGKTTSLKMMCGLLAPDAGTVELDGRRLEAGRARGLREVGVAPQDIVLWEGLTCLEQLEFVGCMYDLPRKTARERARHLLEVFGLAEKADRLGKTLSGGMQRRLNIALGLVHEPRLLFLDEPQAGLDPQSRVLVRDYLGSLRGKATVVITTHDMEEAEKLCDRVCIVDHGKRLVLDTVAALQQQVAGGDVFEVEVAPGGEGCLGEIAKAHAELSVQGSVLLVGAKAGPAGLAEALQAIGRSGATVAAVRSRQVTLEDVFIHLTGRRLRE